MQKKFLTNLGLLITLNLLIKPFWILGIDRSVQNEVGAEAYGTYYALFNAAFLPSMLLDLGITNYNNRNIAQYGHLLARHFPAMTTIKLLLGAGYLAVSLTMGLFLGFEGHPLFLLLVLGINQFISSLILFFRSNISGLHRFREDSFLSVLDRALMILFCSLLLWGNILREPFRIEWFVYAQTGAYLLTAAAALAILAAHGGRFSFTWNPAFFLAVIRQSFPFALLVLLMTIYAKADAVMLERMLPDSGMEAGIYAQGYRLLDAAGMFSYLFAVLLLPMFAKMLKNREKVDDLTAVSFRLIASMSVIVSICCFSFREELMDLLYDEHSSSSSPVFGLLIFCFIPVSLNYLFGTLLTANGNLTVLNMIAGGAVMLNIALNLYLIPRIGALGAAIASLTTLGLTALAQTALAIRLFRFATNWRLIAATALFLAGSVTAGNYSRMISEDWQVTGALLALILSLLALVTRMVDLKSLYRILKS